MRPDLGDPPRERAATAHDHVADGQPVHGPAVDGHDPAHVGDVAPDHARCDGRVLERAADLEKRGELLVLGSQRPEAEVLRREPLVLRFERPVVASQLVDLGNRADHGPRLDTHGVDRVLGRGEREGQAALELLGDRRGARRHEQDGDGEQDPVGDEAPSHHPRRPVPVSQKAARHDRRPSAA